MPGRPTIEPSRKSSSRRKNAPTTMRLRRVSSARFFFGFLFFSQHLGKAISQAVSEIARPRLQERPSSPPGRGRIQGKHRSTACGRAVKFAQAAGPGPQQPSRYHTRPCTCASRLNNDAPPKQLMELPSIQPTRHPPRRARPYHDGRVVRAERPGHPARRQRD